MLRTSVSQFDFMVQFMARHGDLNRATAPGPHGRIEMIKKWEELTTSLNLDATGTSKTVDKWRKVWSDLKNNTKKKALKLAALDNNTLSSGYPIRNKLSLTALEERVLNICGYKGPSPNSPMSQCHEDENTIDLGMLEQSVGSNESNASDHNETDQLDLDNYDNSHVDDTLENETEPHPTIQVEIIEEVKTEKPVIEDTPENVNEVAVNIITETNKLFAKIIEQELVLVPKRRRIGCMQEMLGVIKKYST